MNYYPITRQLAWLLPCLFLWTTPLQAQYSSQQITQSFNAVGIDSLSLDVVSSKKIVYRKTPGTRVLVEVTIEVEKATPSIMAVLTRSTRYKLIETIENGVLKLSAPADNPPIKIGDNVVKELVSYKVYIPRNLWKK